jgi:RNA polymerase sigma factor (sigma-70 family)
MDHDIFKNARQLTNEEVRDLLAKFKQGEHETNEQFAARQTESTEAGLKLIQSQIAWVAKRLQSTPRPPNVEVEDVISELIFVFLDAMKTFDPDVSKLSTFLTRVFDNRAQRIIRKLAGKFSDTPPEMLDTLESRDRSSAEASDPELIESVRDVLRTASISAGARQVLMDHLDGYPLKIIAERLNKRISESSMNVRKHTPSSVHSIIKTSIATIKEALANRGHISLEKGFQKFFDGMQP